MSRSIHRKISLDRDLQYSGAVKDQWDRISVVATQCQSTFKANIAHILQEIINTICHYCILGSYTGLIQRE